MSMRKFVEKIRNLSENDKIVYKNYFYDNISDLEKSYIPKANLSQEDEIYFAKLYSSIYFDNSSSSV